ncbi:HET-domain-containing protein [Polychaeton citri CBS 116435]|uniref:HET-domain-containing protein n=1 Tax=Polychaeton citri CBS 116435 TaxID=1314669 RepID=A0A9P4Q163_9PEZI|nr:HET-domain-containing protein [Polychaeton citri CBS 116435]
MASTYQYNSLPGTGSIRILVLEPSLQFRDPIHCHLEVAQLTRAAKYHALSYCWATEAGDASLCRILNIHGERLPVTRNLYEGLLRLRSRTRSRRLWVDAVCINQKDNDEKGRQVAIMADIYANANHVKVWLGEGHSQDEDLEALRVIECIGQRRHDSGGSSAKTISYHDFDTCALRELLEGDWESMDAVQLKDAIPSIVKLTDKLLPIAKRRYFSRRWMVQELRLASSITFCWGSCSCPASTFMSMRMLFLLDDCAALLKTCGHQTTESIYTRIHDTCWPFTEFCSWYFVEEMSGYDGKIDLAAYLEATSGLACSDPRDRIYALLSLDSDCKLRPDYNVTAAEAFINFAKEIVEAGQASTLLKNLVRYPHRHPGDDGSVFDHPVEGLPFEQKIEGLPSWVPDFTDRFMSFQVENGHEEPFVATVVESVVLECTLYFWGKVVSHSIDYIDDRGLRVGSVDLHRDPRHFPSQSTVWARQEPTSICVDFSSKCTVDAIKAEDMVFSMLSPADGTSAGFPKFLALRSVAGGAREIVYTGWMRQCIDAKGQLRGLVGGKGIRPDEDMKDQIEVYLRSLSKVSVNIH